MIQRMEGLRQLSCFSEFGTVNFASLDDVFGKRFFLLPTESFCLHLSGIMEIGIARRAKELKSANADYDGLYKNVFISSFAGTLKSKCNERRI